MIVYSLVDRLVLPAVLLNVDSDGVETCFLHSHVWNYVDDDDDGDDVRRSVQVLFVSE